MSHPPEPLLSHNEESMTEHRMSHAPETSLSSRELVKRIELAINELHKDDCAPINEYDIIERYIEAWIQVREGEARRNEASIWNSIRITTVNLPGQSQIEARNRIIELESTLATARKQLEGTP